MPQIVIYTNMDLGDRPIEYLQCYRIRSFLQVLLLVIGQTHKSTIACLWISSLAQRTTTCGLRLSRPDVKSEIGRITSHLVIELLWKFARATGTQAIGQVWIWAVGQNACADVQRLLGLCALAASRFNRSSSAASGSRRMTRPSSGTESSTTVRPAPVSCG